MVETPNEPLKVQLSLDGEQLEVGAFAKAVSQLLCVLESVGASAAGAENSVGWVVTGLRMSSPATISIEPRRRHPEVSPSALPLAVALATRGLLKMREGESRPEGFSREAVKAAAGLADMRAHRLDRITLVASGLTLEAPTKVVLDERIVASAKALSRPAYHENGTIDGRLETVTVRSGPQLKVIDRVSRALVLCRTEESTLRDIGRLVGKRVRITGMIRAASDGTPLSIGVEKCEEVDSAGAPDLDSIIGTGRDYPTGSAEFGDRIREDWER